MAMEEMARREVAQMRGLLLAENNTLRAELDRLRVFIRNAGLSQEAGVPDPMDAAEMLRQRVCDIEWPSERIARAVEQARWWNGQKWSDVETLEHLVWCTEGDLLRVGNFGRTSLEELKRMLAKMHLYLAPCHLSKTSGY